MVKGLTAGLMALGMMAAATPAFAQEWGGHGGQHSPGSVGANGRGGNPGPGGGGGNPGGGQWNGGNRGGGQPGAAPPAPQAPAPSRNWSGNDGGRGGDRGGGDRGGGNGGGWQGQAPRPAAPPPQAFNGGQDRGGWNGRGNGDWNRGPGPRPNQPQPGPVRPAPGFAGDGRPDFARPQPGRPDYGRPDYGRPNYGRPGTSYAPRGDNGYRAGWQGGGQRLSPAERWGGGRPWSNDWRRDNRYDWQGYRAANRGFFHLSPYRPPMGWGYGYSRFSIGAYLGSSLFDSGYWIDDPYSYRLPPADGPLRWVRYYDDALLVDIRDGYVVDVIHNVFW